MHFDFYDELSANMFLSIIMYDIMILSYFSEALKNASGQTAINAQDQPKQIKIAFKTLHNLKLNA
jgi:hypothetical protein